MYAMNGCFDSAQQPRFAVFLGEEDANKAEAERGSKMLCSLPSRKRHIYSFNTTNSA